jgi:serine/threonine-protein kinase
VAELLGTQVGNIRLVDLLGRGGMGDVYVGFDVKLNRKVAVKAIRPEHRLHAEAKARLLREARSLSKLDHPNICRIYDYIEGDDSDLLVLEFIEGRNLKTLIDEDIRETSGLRIGEQIAEVLRAAHAANIVHRDLKPDNVMLTASDEVKVLDFGIARSLEEERAATVQWQDRGGEPSQSVVEADPESTLALAGRSKMDSAGPTADTVPEDPALIRTRIGSVIGTVAYMSPEQARGEIVTPASDMYAFGLLLQEMFTKQPPLDLSLPTRTLLARAAEGDSAEVSGVDRDLAELISALKSVSPGDRPTAAEAAERLRWIRLKPRRRMRRLGIAAAMLIVVLGAVKYTLDLRRERNLAIEAQQAEEQARIAAEQVASFLIELFEVSDPSEARGNTVTARELLDRGGERIRSELAKQPLTRTDLMGTIGLVYRKLGLYHEAAPLLEEALEIQTALLADDDLQLAVSMDNLAGLYIKLGRYDDAEPLYRGAVDICEKVQGPQHADLAGLLNNLALVYLHQGRDDEAERLYRRALTIKEETLGHDHPAVANSLINLAHVHRRRGSLSEAERLYRHALEIREGALAADHPDIAVTLNDLASLCFEQEHAEEAERLYLRALSIQEKSLGPDHPDLGSSLSNLGLFYLDVERYREAERHFGRALVIFEKAYGPDHPMLSYPLRGLGAATHGLGRPGDAEAALERALSICERSLPPHHQSLRDTAKEYAEILRALGRGGEATRLEQRLRLGDEPGG